MKKFYQPKTIIFSEGDPVLGGFFLKSGTVKVLSTSNDGEETLLHLANAGSYLGIFEIFLNQKNRQTRIETVTKVEITPLSRDEVLTKLDHLAVLKSLSLMLGLIEDRIFMAHHMNIDERVIYCKKIVKKECLTRRLVSDFTLISYESVLRSQELKNLFIKIA